MRRRDGGGRRRCGGFFEAEGQSLGRRLVGARRRQSGQRVEFLLRSPAQVHRLAVAQHRLHPPEVKKRATKPPIKQLIDAKVESDFIGGNVFRLPSFQVLLRPSIRVRGVEFWM